MGGGAIFMMLFCVLIVCLVIPYAVFLATVNIMIIDNTTENFTEYEKCNSLLAYILPITAVWNLIYIISYSVIACLISGGVPEFVRKMAGIWNII